MQINSFLAAQGIYKKLSPRKIVLKRSLIFERNTKGFFVSYAETNKDTVIKNTKRSRKFTGILLGTTGNIHGTQFSLI